MNYFKRFSKLFKSYTEQEYAYIDFIRNLTNTYPLNLALYKLALQHTSVAETNQLGFKESNERLEFLGDVVLDLIVADHLFHIHPYESEGFLTEIKSRLVNREQLKYLALETGLAEFIPLADKNQIHSHIYGNAMEAFIGALYLDLGFKKTSTIVLNLLKSHLDMEVILNQPYNYKSVLLEWSQKTNQKLVFITTEVNEANSPHRFQTLIQINGEDIAKGFARNKKKSERKASEAACKILDLTDNDTL